MTKVRLVFLGKLADLAGAQVREMDAPLDWRGVLAALEPALAEAVQADTTRTAVNGQLLAEKTALAATGGDEIAFLPPVSGG